MSSRLLVAEPVQFLAWASVFMMKGWRAASWTAGSHTQGEIDDLTDDVVGLFAQYKGAVS
jgi:hypothetical protein